MRASDPLGDTFANVFANGSQTVRRTQSLLCEWQQFCELRSLRWSPKGDRQIRRSQPLMCTMPQIFPVDLYSCSIRPSSIRYRYEKLLVDVYTLKNIDHRFQTRRDRPNIHPEPQGFPLRNARRKTLSIGKTILDSTDNVGGTPGEISIERLKLKGSL